MKRRYLIGGVVALLVGGVVVWKLTARKSSDPEQARLRFNDPIFETGGGIKVGNKDTGVVKPFGVNPFAEPKFKKGDGFVYEKSVGHTGFDVDLEDRLREYLLMKFPQEGDEGEQVTRVRGKNGRVEGERWSRVSGEEIVRSFFEEGQIKGLRWKRSDGTETVLNLRQNGVFEARRDRLSTGNEIVTKFDDAGKVMERWKVSRGGTKIRIQ